MLFLSWISISIIVCTASYLEKVLTPQNEIQNQLRAKQLYRPVPVQRRDQFFVRTVDS